MPEDADPLGQRYEPASQTEDRGFVDWAVADGECAAAVRQASVWVARLAPLEICRVCARLLLRVGSPNGVVADSDLLEAGPVRVHRVDESRTGREDDLCAVG